MEISPRGAEKNAKGVEMMSRNVSKMRKRLLDLRQQNPGMKIEGRVVWLKKTWMPARERKGDMMELDGQVVVALGRKRKVEEMEAAGDILIDVPVCKRLKEEEDMEMDITIGQKEEVKMVNKGTQTESVINIDKAIQTCHVTMVNQGTQTERAVYTHTGTQTEEDTKSEVVAISLQNKVVMPLRGRKRKAEEISGGSNDLHLGPPRKKPALVLS